MVKYGSVEALAQGHVETLKRFGKDPSRLIEIPEKPDDKAGWDAVHKALGRPDKPEDYGVSIFEGASEGDQKFAKDFVEKAHAAGASQAVVAAAIETLNEAGAAAAAAAQAAREVETKAVQDQLKKDWGDKHDHYTKAIGKLLLDGGDQIAGEGGGERLVEEMNAKGLGNSPVLMKLLASLLDKQAEPEGLPGGGRGDGGAMTPYQANAALAALHGDDKKRAALEDRNDPLHATVLAERNALIKMANPNDSRQPTDPARR